MRIGADTNWNRLKRDKCFSSRYIGSVIGVDSSTVNAWLGGRSIPNNVNMIKLCELFGIDQTTGRKLFEADRNGTFYDIASDNSAGVTTQDPKPAVVIANQWRTLFDTCGYTRIELANYCGVHPTTISNWESGRYVPTWKQMPKLGELFNLSAEKCYELATIAHKVYLGDYDASANTSDTIEETPKPITNVHIKDILGKFIDFEVDPSAIYMFLTEYKQCAEDTDAVLLGIYGKINAVDYQKIYKIVGLGL